LHTGIDREVRAVTATDLTALIDGDEMLGTGTTALLASLVGLRVDNALIEIDGPEVPIMDGSAAAFVAAIEQAGIVTLPAPRRYIQVLCITLNTQVINVESALKASALLANSGTNSRCPKLDPLLSKSRIWKECGGNYHYHITNVQGFAMCHV
jgi:UDP-3-O-acyl-N-acetylglucosamine deacetylase